MKREYPRARKKGAHSRKGKERIAVTDQELHYVPFYWEEAKCLHQFTAYPVYFVTIYAYRTRHVLAGERAHETMRDEWRVAERKHGWRVGRYLILPERVYFTCTAVGGERVSPMAFFVNRWKIWTERRMQYTGACPEPLWRRGFGSWCLNQRTSCADRWKAVHETPVRYGLAEKPEDWPFQGFIGFKEPL